MALAQFFDKGISAVICVVRGPGRGSNLMENMLTQFFERPTPGKIVGKTRPLREITVEKKETGEGYH